MPANLPPSYYSAEERFRQASSAEEKIRILEEMLAIMPKHKGTDHLQADLRAKISRLKKEGSKKKVVAKFNPYAVERDDCPQIVMVGPPNSGKSSLLNYLTGASSEVADYPYTTVKPNPGIFRGDNFRFQLVDLPPVVGGTMEGWMGDLIRHADGLILILDVSSSKTLAETEKVFKALDRANIFLRGLKTEESPLGTIPQKTLIVLTKCDIANPEILELLRSEFQFRFTIIETSTINGVDFKHIAHQLARTTGFIRIFTKIPGRKADLEEPYIVKSGITVFEMAQVIHRDIADNFQFARVWGKSAFNGQKVGKEHILCDGDIIEIH